MTQTEPVEGHDAHAAEDGRLAEDGQPVRDARPIEEAAGHAGGAGGVDRLQRHLKDALDAGAFEGGTGGGRGGLMGVPITLRAVLGEARLPVARFLALGPGDMVTLDRLVGEPIELTVNDAPIARGEIVMLDEETGRLGVRVSALLDAA